MQNTVHFILQGKGGIGKTLVSTLLAQWIGGKDDTPLRCYDTDQENATFSRYKAMNVKHVPVMTDARNPASALPPLSDPEYYPARQLDVYPELVQPVSLEYANDNAGGRVLLMVLIDETGGVREISIVEAGSARLVENSVRTAFSEARFSPARKDGRAVKSRVLISVDYRPGDTEGRP